MAKMRKKVSIKDFILKFWSWNLLFDIAIFIFCYLLFAYEIGQQNYDIKVLILVSIAIFLIFLHSIFLFIFSIIKFFRKGWLQGILLLIHLTFNIYLSQYLFLPLFTALGPIGY